MKTTDTTPGAGSEILSAVDFPTATRLHVALNVKNVETSRKFYEAMFGVVPAKVRPGYVKFEVIEPPVNLTLNEVPEIPKGPHQVSHFGVQVKSQTAILEGAARFAKAGLKPVAEENTTCCYAEQNKVWLTDPDGNPWELFLVTKADTPVHSVKKSGEPAANCCTPQRDTKEKAGTSCCG